MINKGTLKRLNSLPRARCFKCKKFRYYTNPLAQCYSCGQKFCYDHIHGGHYSKGIKASEELKDVCDKCLEGGF